ncbi:GNAT family N-acetyltransferase [Parasphingopyxis algicola]|uniref:GNAT family N-acetyltransferase n=1 Tax=Parasphingopyxis algicola TaxID=2026624 RepID=UPI0015A19729|nr:GNAT family protein [Parasphingopyxis algicola]QLC25187.1 GNAT family N-acetyltransferase [Parasphingopyxis algicola]
MPADPDKLAAPLSGGNVRLELRTEDHREGLRAACAADPAIWEIYPFSMLGEHFDPGFDRIGELSRTRGWVNYAVLDGDTVVGMTNYIEPGRFQPVLEIGGTYIVPEVRGGPFNRTMKTLMIDHAIACGYTRIEFRVDARNKRSMAAVLKLGATHEGTLRQNRITWTGYVRDTAIFGLLADEWTNRE